MKEQGQGKNKLKFYCLLLECDLYNDLHYMAQEKGQYVCLKTPVSKYLAMARGSICPDLVSLQLKPQNLYRTNTFHNHYEGVQSKLKKGA